MYKSLVLYLKRFLEYRKKLKKVPFWHHVSRNQCVCWPMLKDTFLLHHTLHLPTHGVLKHPVYQGCALNIWVSSVLHSVSKAVKIFFLHCIFYSCLYDSLNNLLAVTTTHWPTSLKIPKFFHTLPLLAFGNLKLKTVIFCINATVFDVFRFFWEMRLCILYFYFYFLLFMYLFLCLLIG